ncbi:hypothetical protein ACMU_10710 [Actibacterium mucosum KCTC 23349]|uniref:TNase-like domain-containing protein n=1 Tax=Actibacterium mucosum KCTC 23349 TaxID=1454373 RepID=A0A037ZIE0_9RHOB|nr:hypothetical protein [Actibacterium mucosum]KAJ56215.1 hypothetical protein ACMU_10710 [Actibacterium mucosum KCTC 23349]
MARPRRKVVRFSRDYRKARKFDMGLPPYRPGSGKRKRRSRQFFLVIAIVLLAFGPSLGDIANGYLTPHDGCRVVRVIDGDTVTLICPLSGIQRGRILAYDTPEMNAQCTSEALKAFAAKQYLRWLLWSSGHISARTEGIDRYGRALVLLLIDGKGVARPMIKAGLGKEYSGGRRDSWCT